MIDRNDWNPEDGPEPTQEELHEARSLASALDAPKEKVSSADIDALLETALRVQATVRAPSAAATVEAVKASVDHAVKSQGAQRWYRTRARWLAVAAAVVLGVGGAGLAARNRTTAKEHRAPITHSADDVFSAPIGSDPGSDPMERLESARMRSYRSALLRGGAR